MSEQPPSTQPETPTARVVFQPDGRQGQVPVGISLLEAARRLGVEIESICGGHQTCGKCRVVVEEGSFAKYGLTSRADHLTPAGEREQAYAERRGLRPEERLSCACRVQGDLVIRVPPESQLRKQVIRKAASTQRAITVDPAVRLYYVELPPAHLKDHRGDWERLRDELAAVHGLEALAIDPAILPDLQPALAAGERRVTATVWDERQVIQVRPGFHEDLYGMAFDIGTTTVAGYLCHLRTGQVLATVSAMNPQVPYGEDLMSRVSYAMLHPDGTERMHRAIVQGINELIRQACDQAGIAPEEVVELVVVGNTTMHHLFLGIDPRELGGAPFSLATHSALDLKARDLGLGIAPGGNVHVPPCEAGHVGPDNVAVLIAEAPYRQDEATLVIDVGTNGEILLGSREEIFSASSPTGPAFEGAQIRHGMRAAPGAIERVRIDPETLEVRYKIIGQEEWIESRPDPLRPDSQDPASEEAGPRARRRRRDRQAPLKAAGICGSGIIEAVAELFLAGVLGPSGRFVEIHHPRLRRGLGEGGAKAEFILAYPHETRTGQAITVHSDDVRAIQLGKAALYAGTRLLMDRLGLEKVHRIVLAGGFGSYIDPLHAMVLGLIPDCPLERVTAVGNAAGDGARMILLDRSKRAEAQWAARWVTYVETAVEPSFQEAFVEAIPIPHARDPFPHVAQVLARAQTRWSPERVAAVAEQQEGPRAGRRTSPEARAARRARRAARRPA